MLNKTVKNSNSINVFQDRNKRFTLTFAVIALLTIGSSMITGFSFSEGIMAFPKAFGWMANNFVPDRKAITLLPNIIDKLFETVLMAISATVIAAILAMAFAISGSGTTVSNRILPVIVRFFASIFRNIPVVAWALILMFSFGQSMFTGLLAIFVETFGFFVRTFIETIDESSAEPVEALRAAGATRMHAIFQAVFPSVLPQIISWILYMIESNIRNATLVGLLTGTGIGFLFDMYYKRMYYTSAAMVVLSIVVTVILVEYISNHLRRIIQ